MSAEEEQTQPEAKQQDSPEEQSMETNTSTDDAKEQGKEAEKRKEAKVCLIFTNLTCLVLVNYIFN